MKKILVLLTVLFTSCSNEPTISEEAKAWIGKIYDQGWYWSTIGDDSIPSNTLVPFFSDGSFIGSITPWDNSRFDFPRQEVLYVLDEAVSETQVYYTFTYTFNGEKLTLYIGVAKGVYRGTTTPVLYWASYYNYEEPPSISASNSEKKEWLVNFYKKENMNLDQGHILGLKKNNRSTLSHNVEFTDYVEGNNSTSLINAVQK